MAKTSISPALFTDIYKVHKNFQDRMHTQSQESLTLKRDYLCFTLPYLLGRSCDELLTLSFKQLGQNLPSKSWKNWLNNFEQQLQKPTPWFHTARHSSLREGLSRRGLELILKSQIRQFKIEQSPWSYKSLRQAYVLKSLQTGISELKIKYFLGMSDSYSFKSYYQYLQTHKESEHLYLELQP